MFIRIVMGIYRGKMIGLHGRKELAKDVFKPNLPSKAIEGTDELLV